MIMIMIIKCCLIFLLMHNYIMNNPIDNWLSLVTKIFFYYYFIIGYKQLLRKYIF